MTNLIEINELSKIYKTKNGEVKALDGVSLKLPENGLVFVTGISGSGKTTLINLIAGIDSATSGEVLFKGDRIDGFSEDKWSVVRNLNIGIVFQDFNLLDDLSVFENIALPLRIQKVDASVINERVNEALEFVGLPGYGERPCSTLSAGQKQRIAIARSIVKDPEVILADEATGNLDPINTDSILELFNSISKKILVVLISHDIDSAYNYGDRIIKLSEGKITEDIDNSINKDLYERTYMVEVKSEGRSYVTPLNDFDIKREIIKSGCFTGRLPDDIEMNLRITDNHSDLDAPLFSREMKSNELKPLSFGIITEHALKYLRNNKLRFFISLFILVFLYVIFLLSVIVISNDYYGAVFKYLSDSDQTVVPVQMYDRNLGEESIKSKGNDITSIVRKSSNGEFFKCVNIIVKTPNEEKSGNAEVLCFENDTFLEQYFVSGNAPKDVYEVMVDQKLADDYGLKVDDTIFVEEKQCKICGICNIPQNGNVKHVIANVKLLENDYVNDNSCYVMSADIAQAYDKDAFSASYTYIGKLSQLKDETVLTWGRLPNAENEIAVSEEYAKTLGSDYKSGDFITIFNLPDLHSESNLQYSECFNLYDIVGKRVVITGVYGSDSAEGDVLFEDSIYNKIINEYRDGYIYDSCFVSLDYSKKGLIKDLATNNIEVSNIQCDLMYRLNYLIHANLRVIIILLFVLFVIIAFMMINNLSLSIKDDSRRIGIYKVLGVDKIGIAGPYLIINIMICVLSVLAANILSVKFSGLLNDSIVSFAELDGFSFLNPDGLTVFAVDMGLLFLSVVLTLIPLRLLMKKKPVQILGKKD